MSKMCILPQAAPFKELAALYPSTDNHRQYVHWVISTNNGNSIKRTRSDEESKLYNKIFEILNKDPKISYAGAEKLAMQVKADYIANSYAGLSSEELDKLEESVEHLGEKEITAFAENIISTFKVNHTNVNNSSSISNKPLVTKDIFNDIELRLFNTIQKTWLEANWLYTEEEARKLNSKLNPNSDFSTVSGMYHRGKVWLNSTTASNTSNVAFHEYGHMWYDSLFIVNRQLYDRISELMRSGFKDLWDAVSSSKDYGQNPEVLKRGEEYRTRYISSEVFSRIVGDTSHSAVHDLIKQAQEQKDNTAIQKVLNDIKEFFSTILRSLISNVTKIVKDYFGIDESIYKDVEASRKVLKILKDLDSTNVNKVKTAIDKIAMLTIKDMLNLVNPYELSGEKELNAIKDEAIKNGTFMKAPNGKKSNLDERQWLQVRTKAFKEWFGDWSKIAYDKDGNVLSIPDDVSKIVDKNGEPLVVYHGSPNKFDMFDLNKANSRYNIHNGEAAWFSKSKKNAETYGKNQYGVFLNIRSLGENDINDTPNINISQLRQKETELLNNPNVDGIRINTIDKNGREIQYAVKSPNQIKSADYNNGSFLAGNDLISYSRVSPDIEQAIVSDQKKFRDNFSYTQQDEIINKLSEISSRYEQSEKDSKNNTNPTVYYKSVTRGLKEQYSPTTISTDDVKIDEDDSTISTDAGNIVHEYVGAKLANPLMTESEVSSKLNAKFFGDKNAGIVGTTKNVTMDINPDSNTTTGSNGNGLNDTFTRIQQQIFNDIVDTNDGDRSALDDVKFLTEVTIPMMSEDGKTRIMGRIDLLAVDKKGNVYVYDFKTSGNNFEYYDNPYYDRDKKSKKKYTTREIYQSQILAYCTMLNKAYGIRPVKSAIIKINVGFEKRKNISSISISTEGDERVNIARVSLNQSVSENNVTTGFDYLDSSNSKVSEIVYKMLGDIVSVGNLFGQVRTSEMAKLNEFSRTKPGNYEVLKLLNKMQAAITLQYDRMSHNYKFVDKARDINKLSAEYATLTREEEQLRKLILYYNNFIIGDLYHKLKEFHDAGEKVDWSSEFRTEHQDEVLDLLQEVRYLKDSINIDADNTIFDAAMSILSKDLNKRGKYNENIDNLIEIKKTLPLINELNRELGSKFLANILHDKTNVFKHNLTVENRDLYDRYAQYERTTNPEQKRLLLASSDISLDVSLDSTVYQKFLSIYNDESLPTVDEKRKAFIDYMVNSALKSGKTLKDYELSQMEQELLHTAHQINKTSALFDSLLNTSDPVCSALVSMWSKQYQEYRRSLSDKELELVTAVEEYEKTVNINHTTMTEREAWSRFLEHDDNGNTTGFLLNNSLSALIEEENELFRKLGSVGDSSKRAKMIKSFYIENYEIISEDGDVSSVIEKACDDLWAKVVAFDDKLVNNFEFETAIKDNYKKILFEYTSKNVLSTRIISWVSIINSVYSETNESDKIGDLYDIIISHEKDWRSENLVPKGKWHNKEWDSFITETIGQEYVKLHPSKQLAALSKSNNPAAKLYMMFRDMAKETDDKLPGRFSIGLQLPGVRKESGERIRDSKGNLVKYVAKQVGEDLAPKEADALRGTAHTDAQGKEYYSIPIHYTQKLDEEDQSYSLPNIYKKYWAMGQHYKLMSEISSVMEVGAAFVRDRDIYKVNADGSIAETKNKIGRTPALSNTNNQADQLDAFMKTYYYKKLTDAAIFNIGNISFDFQKIVTKLNSWTGATMLSLNKNQGIANIITGEASLFISMTKGSKIEFNDWLRAHKIFMKNIPGMMEDIGKRRPTSKAMLLFERFNVVNGETLGEENLNKRTRISSLISRDTLNFMNNFGELSMRGKAFFAMISKIKPKDKNGNVITAMNGKKVDSILDLYDVVDGKLTLVTNDTYDAVKTGWTQKDQDKFMMDFAGIMFYVHGAYGDMDKIAFERNAFFQTFYLFRKYIAPNIIKHWGEKKYINRMDLETEGYMRTPIVFVMNCIKDLKRAKVVLATDALTMDQRFKVIKNRAGALKPYEIANMRKFVKRMSLLAAAVIGAALLGKGDGDDDDEKYQNILKTNAQYQVKRFISELTFYTNPSSAWDILKSPMASLSMIETLIRVLSQLTHPLEKYETGVHAGEYKLVRQTMKLIPVLKQDWIFSADPISDLRQQLQFYDKANVYTR